MDLKEFVKNIAEQFEDTDTLKINANTKFRDIEDYSSLTGMAIIAMIDEKYSVLVSGNELRSVITIRELFNLVLLKANGNK